MNPLAVMAANTVMATQGQDCRFVPLMGDAVLGRCMARPSLEQSYDGAIQSVKYDVTVFNADALKNGDKVELLNDAEEVEGTVTITEPAAVLTAMRVYIGVLS